VIGDNEQWQNQQALYGQPRKFWKIYPRWSFEGRFPSTIS